MSSSRPLTSWKEIASYLDKGVRTVQRWERELGLPVRRPSTCDKHVVVGLPEELDQWTRNKAELAKAHEAVSYRQDGFQPPRNLAVHRLQERLATTEELCRTSADLIARAERLLARRRAIQDARP
jgi:hypothetical protein